MTPRIAIIGCGLVGTTHAECLAELGVAPVAYFDARKDAAHSLASRFGGSVMESVEAAITSPDVNAVYICTYHDTHAPYALMTANAGKHMFIEKPMAITLEESEAIYKAVERNGVLCMTGFKMRYYPLVEKAHDLISQPLMLTGQITEQRWPDDSWANDPIKGGGNVLSQGCHAVDLVCHLAKSRPTRVYAEARNATHPSIDIVDSMVATLAFESGAIASLIIGDLGVPVLTDKLSFQAFDGVRTIHLHDRMKRMAYFDGERSHAFSVASEEAFALENAEFLSAMQDERKPASTHRDGFNATAILLAAIESSQRGCAVDLSDRVR